MTQQLDIVQVMIKARLTLLWKRKRALVEELDFVSELPNEKLENLSKEKNNDQRFLLKDIKITEEEHGSSKHIVDIVDNWCGQTKAKIQNKSLTEVDLLKLKKIIDILYVDK